ncbi:MAG: carbohydrate-binding protein [Acetivibrionales bacterium]|jgi:hypothetical protein
MPRARKTASSNNIYISNGVTITPAVPTSGEQVKIKYDGLLAKSGAAHVYAHVGFNSSWENIYDYPMSRTEMGFETTVPVTKADTMNICFKDCANNWDNNSGSNYSFDIS